ncbi:hypothetical protein ACF0H5_014862 [Mactra antiquata]
MELINWLFVLGVVYVVHCRDCGRDDYKFEYTQCNTDGERWRVSVPKTNDCNAVMANYNLPVKGTDCNKECEGGQFLNMDSQECEACPAGTYSSGSNAFLDDWETLPKGFSKQTETFSSYGEEDDTPIDCKKYDWTPKGSYIAAVPGECAASLIYSVTLVKAGMLKFYYQFPSTTTIFHVTVQNDQCQSSKDKDASKWPDTTSEGEWKQVTLNLKSGFNVITWRVVGLDASGREAPPILLKRISVHGVAFTSNCAKCPAGSFSSENSKMCTLCPENMYSAKGAGMCTACNAALEYSYRGSVNCTQRPPCTEHDYYHLHKPCIDGKTGTLYRWIQPMICNPDLPESKKLPSDSKEEKCSPCNPGMYLDNSTCKYCPPGQKSDGSKCEECEATTAPDYSMTFEKWDSMPDEIDLTCVSFADVECNNETTWLPLRDHLETHFSRGESAYLVLQVKVAGFRTEQRVGDGGTSTVGQFTMLFETTCTESCQLILLSDESGSQDMIKTWDGAQAKSTYTYDVKKNGSFTFTLAFQNSGFPLMASTLTDSVAKIYSIEITNTLEGGASSCRKCPKGIDDGGCIPCPGGSYIDPTTTTCVSCPPGTVVASHNAYGADSCKPCGAGLKVYKGRSCVSDGMFTDDDGQTFDMKNLSNSFQFVQGSLLFTSSGTQYYHGFNISLFGEPEKSYVICANNVSRTDSHSYSHAGKPDISHALQEPKLIVAKICRTTLVPSSEDAKAVMTTQSTSLGDHLVEIIRNRTSLSMNYNDSMTTLKEIYTASGYSIEDIQKDIQVHFAAETPTRACPNGRHTLISLRCDLDQKDKGEITLPPKCADGTCDGCLFHFLLSTRNACPICRKEDFNRVVGECVQGTQKIHYFPPSDCIVLENMAKMEETQTCTMQLTSLPLMVQVGVPVVVGLALLFFILVCFFWRKNKRLEYRYMKLVENAGGAEGELPGVDSCALEEDEDEQGDAVQIRSSKGARFFKKLTNKIKKDDAFESAVLNERMPLT